MDPLVVNATDILRLIALGPCFIVIPYLIISSRTFGMLIVPLLYFVSITLMFLLPILEIFLPINIYNIPTIDAANRLIAPSFAFLFIIELILRKKIPLIYWSVFAVPIIGGGGLFYLLLYVSPTVCWQKDVCLQIADILGLYMVISSLLLLMLATVFILRWPKIHKKDTDRLHKYWLIIALIIFNVLVAMLEIISIAGVVESHNLELLKVAISVCFIYLIITSIFRVFHKEFKITPLKKILSASDKKIAHRILNIINEEKPYRDMEFNRGILSDMLGLTEQHLSKVINNYFGESFTDFINNYRIKDAKDMLLTQRKQVTQISYMAGFSSTATFNRVFKDKVGMSPREYRAAHTAKASTD